MKKTLKQIIFEGMDKNGYITDNQICLQLDKEPSFKTIEEYKRQWRKLHFNKNI